MKRLQTIQIFLPGGFPSGIKIVEITNRLVKAVLISRNQLEDVAKRFKSKNVGNIFGVSDESAKTQTKTKALKGRNQKHGVSPYDSDQSQKP